MECPLLPYLRLYLPRVFTLFISFSISFLLNRISRNRLKFASRLILQTTKCLLHGLPYRNLIGIQVLLDLGFLYGRVPIFWPTNRKHRYLWDKLPSKGYSRHKQTSSCQRQLQSGNQLWEHRCWVWIWSIYWWGCHRQRQDYCCWWVIFSHRRGK